MTYKEALTTSMDQLAEDPRTLFLGYGMLIGRAAGTLNKVPSEQIIETTLAENLMVGMATGLSLTGRLPVVFFERADFLLNAADAIVNHLNAMSIISDNEFEPAVIIRVVIGNSKKPLFTGHTHTQDFSKAFRNMVDFPVVVLESAEDILPAYETARNNQLAGLSTMLFERKDLW